MSSKQIFGAIPSVISVDWDQATVEDMAFHVAALVDADQGMVSSVCDLAFLALVRAPAGLFSFHRLV